MTKYLRTPVSWTGVRTNLVGECNMLIFWYKRQQTNLLKEQKSRPTADSEKQSTTATYIVNEAGEPVNYAIACEVGPKPTVSGKISSNKGSTH